MEKQNRGEHSHLNFLGGDFLILYIGSESLLDMVGVVVTINSINW